MLAAMGCDVLCLDGTGRPLGFVPWHRAVALLLLSRAQLLEAADNAFLCSQRLAIPYPLVVQATAIAPYRSFVYDLPQRPMVLARDGFRCQYCNTAVSPRSGTVDHLVPRAEFRRQGRPDSDADAWENVVTACHRCNNLKGDALPGRRWRARQVPRRPNFLELYWASFSYHPVQARYVSAWYQVPRERLPVKVPPLPVVREPGGRQVWPG